MAGNIVYEYKDGPTTFQFCDDYYKDKTKEDVEQILRKIAEDAVVYFRKKGTA